MLDRAIGVIRNNAMAQSQLIEDILDVSRIIGGKLRFEADARCPLRDVIEAALDSVSPAAQAKAIEIVRDIDDSSRSPATTIACSRSCGTCSRTPSSSRRAKAG
jgi:signal transduction histidine kinase